jgi:hypothetical protein
MNTKLKVGKKLKVALAIAGVVLLALAAVGCTSKSKTTSADETAALTKVEHCLAHGTGPAFWSCLAPGGEAAMEKCGEKVLSQYPHVTRKGDREGLAQGLVTQCGLQS